MKTQGQTIVIEPATTEIVYVPQYDPWVVYGAPMAVLPGWYPYPGLFLPGPGIDFELGFAVAPAPPVSRITRRDLAHSRFGKR